MMSKRRLMQWVAGLSLLPPAWARQEERAAGWRMPDEAALHARTWMAFGPSEAIWGRRLLPGARASLARLAGAIVRHEPVTLLVRPKEMALARGMVDARVTLLACPLDDLWIRDTGPVFIQNAKGDKAAVDLNFNGWGDKQAHGRDAEVAAFVARQAGVRRLVAPLVLEGGGLEVDGEGTAILTESCTLNPNRNPGVSKAQFEDQLMPLLGLRKIIWLPGIQDHDITDGHVDFYARFAAPGVVLAAQDDDPDSFDHEVTQRHLELLRSATDAQGRKLKVLPLRAPETLRERRPGKDFAAGYIGYYVCNGAVIMQSFGDDAADTAARRTLQAAYPGRSVEAIDFDGVAIGGGTIHCATQQEIA